MAKINRKELAQLSVEQLKEKFIGLKKELMKLNMQRATGTPPENPGMIRATRKSIARIHTYITQKKKATAIETPQKKEQTKVSHSKKTEVKKKK